MKVLIWGASQSGVKAVSVCKYFNWEIVALIDSDLDKCNSLFQNYKVLQPEKIQEEILHTNPLIIIASHSKEVQSKANKLSQNIMQLEDMERLWRLCTKANYPEVQLNQEALDNCKLIATREDMLKMFPQGMVMAEIGSFKGDFGQCILDICKPEKLYIIDAWEGERWEPYYNVVKKRFQKEIDNQKVELLKGYSTEKLNMLENNSLDWAYIDTVHDYETTAQELRICHQKVKDGGYICGHDYTNYNAYSRMDYGVWAAVNEFVMEFGYEFIYLTMEFHGWQSFAIRRR